MYFKSLFFAILTFFSVIHSGHAAGKALSPHVSKATATRKSKPQPKKIASTAKKSVKKAPVKKTFSKAKQPVKKSIKAVPIRKGKAQPKNTLSRAKAPAKSVTAKKVVSIAKAPVKKSTPSIQSQPQPERVNPTPQTKALAPQTTTPAVSSQQKSLQKPSSSQSTLMATKKVREQEIKKIKEASEKALKDLQTQSEQKKQLTVAKQKEFQDAWLDAYTGDKNKLAWVESLSNDPDILSWVEHSMPFNYFHPDKYESSKNPAHAKRLADFAFSIADNISNTASDELDGVTAIKWYTTAINTQKDHLKALQGLAKLYHHGLKDKNGGYLIEPNPLLAFHHYKKISPITPHSSEVAEALTHLGNMFHQGVKNNMGDYLNKPQPTLAKQCYEEAFVINPNSTEVNLKLGDLYFSGASHSDARYSNPVELRKAFSHYFRALTSGNLPGEQAQEITKLFFNGKSGDSSDVKWPLEALPTDATTKQIHARITDEITALSIALNEFPSFKDFSSLQENLAYLMYQSACMVRVENEELKNYLLDSKNNAKSKLYFANGKTANNAVTDEIRLMSFPTTNNGTIVFISLGHESVKAADAFKDALDKIARASRYPLAKAQATTLWSSLHEVIMKPDNQAEKRKALKASLGWLPDLDEKTP